MAANPNAPGPGPWLGPGAREPQFDPMARIAHLSGVLAQHNVPTNVIGEIFGTQQPVNRRQRFRDAARLRDANDRVVTCVACGGVCRPSVESSPISVPDGTNPRDKWDHPWLIKAKIGFLWWTREKWTWSAYQRSDAQQIELYRVLHFMGGPDRFIVAGLGDVCIDTTHAEMYLPIHRPCYNLALAFCRYQSQFTINFRDLSSPEGGAPSSIAHLYEIWMKRAILALRGTGPLRCPIPGPNNYDGIEFVSSLAEYGRILRGMPAPATQTFDPTGEPLQTTYTIVDRITKLHRDETQRPAIQELRARIRALPIEIQTMIEDYMCPLELNESQLVCTRVLPPEIWKARLFRGKWFPWLYDLDLDQAEQAMDHEFGFHFDTDGNLDWELLCRQLAMPYVFGFSRTTNVQGIMYGVKYLENRHRIWRLFDTARLVSGGQGVPYA